MIQDTEEQKRKNARLIERARRNLIKYAIEKKRAKEEERPFELMIDEKIESYENYLIKYLSNEIMHKIRQNNRPIDESKLWMYSSSFIQDNKRFKIKYTDLLIDKIVDIIKQKLGKKYIIPESGTRTLDDLFWN